MDRDNITESTPLHMAMQRQDIDLLVELLLPHLSDNAMRILIYLEDIPRQNIQLLMLPF